MKVALVSEHASPLALLGGADAGGQNVHVAELARALGRRGVEVTVHTRRDSSELPRRVAFAPNVVIEHVDAGPARPVPKDDLLPLMDEFAAGLRRSWTRDRPDVAHSHFWMSGLASLDAARHLDLPLLHTFHALGVEKRAHQGAADTSPAPRIDIERDVAMGADAVVATTAAERELLAAMGADRARIHVVPCGVDLDAFHPLAGARRRRRRSSDPLLVLSAGRLVPRKGVADLIAALPWAPRVQLLVVGGEPCDGDRGRSPGPLERMRLAALASELGVSGRVIFLGPRQREAMPDLFRAVDVVACCPWYEPFGMVAVEAMACGVPVVASAVGGLAETVVDGTTGLLVAPRSPEAVAAALRRLSVDDPVLARLGRASVTRAEAYGWDAIAHRTLEVATRVAGRRLDRGLAS